MIETKNIWTAFSVPLLNFVKTRVPAEDAEDVLQDSFIKIHSGIKSIQNTDRLQSWVYQTTRNTINDYYRSKQKALNTVISDGTDLLDSYEDHHDHVVDDLSQCLRPLISELSDTHREVIQLSELKGLKHAEIASQLGLSLTAVKSRVQRGKKELVDRFVEHCNFHINEKGKLVGEHLCDQDHDCHTC